MNLMSIVQNRERAKLAVDRTVYSLILLMLKQSFQNSLQMT
jgi:hypothetical protein